MEKAPIHESDNWQFMLGDEASAGISFSNTLAAIATALLGVLIAFPPSQINKEIPILVGTSQILTSITVVVLISSFYSTICYANTFGAMRLKLTKERCLRPVIWGNSLSEHLGIFVINVIITIGVFGYTFDPIQVRITYLLIAFGFLTYHLAGFDLLSRVISNVYWKLVVVVIFISINIGIAESLIAQSSKIALILSIIYVLCCAVLMAFDIIKLQESDN